MELLEVGPCFNMARNTHPHPSIAQIPHHSGHPTREEQAIYGLLVCITQVATIML